MRYTIECEMRLEFAAPVREHHGELRLVPRQDERQKLIELSVSCDPESETRFYHDCFGNRICCFDVTPPHEEICVRVACEVETLLANPFDYRPVGAGRERAWLEREIEREPRLLDFVLHHCPLTPAIDAHGELFAGAPAWRGDEALLDRVVAARDWVAARVELDSSAEPAADLAEVLRRGSGTAADVAQALVAVVRGWKVPARFVAGYQDVGDDPPEDTAAHAWADVLIPGAGWRGFDPVNRLIANDRYVAVAVGRDAGDTRALRHVFKGDDGEELQRMHLVISRQGQQ